MQIRTDLALEAKESFEGDGGEIPGVELEKESYNIGNSTIHVSTVRVTDEHGSSIMHKPIGNYITIETGNTTYFDEKENEKVEKLVAAKIKMLAGDIENKKILVAGLGNRDITSDSLGPFVVDNLMVTRHYAREFGCTFLESIHAAEVCALAPGVMAQTGMEAEEVISAIAGKTKPDVIIVIDALAARSMHRVNTTIQITDTGINPGSGVGNHRVGLNEEKLGVRVIGIGVPTVIEAGVILRDGIEEIMNSYGFDENEIEDFLKGTFTKMNNMYVTSKDIDDAVERMGELIAESINTYTHREMA